MEKLNQTATERRRLTRNRIYRYLYSAPQGRSKQEIADDLGLSTPDRAPETWPKLLRAELVQTNGMRGVDRRAAGRAAVGGPKNARFALGVSVSGETFPHPGRQFAAGGDRLPQMLPPAHRQPGRAGARLLAEELAQFHARLWAQPRKSCWGAGIALPAILKRRAHAGADHRRRCTCTMRTCSRWADASPCPVLFEQRRHQRRLRRVVRPAGEGQHCLSFAGRRRGAGPC